MQVYLIKYFVLKVLQPQVYPLINGDIFFLNFKPYLLPIFENRFSYMCNERDQRFILMHLHLFCNFIVFIGKIHDTNENEFKYYKKIGPLYLAGTLGIY